MKLSTALSILVFGSTAWSKPTPISLAELCTVNSPPVYIGKEKNVMVQYASCPENESLTKGHSLEKRQVPNVCGAPCTTSCWTPAGGGPNEKDCNIIADALRYESQNSQSGPFFQVPNGSPNNTIVMSYASCKSYFLNQYIGPLTYCRVEWAQLIDYLAPRCNAANGAHGGLCVANDQSWYVQVQATPKN